MKLTHYEIEVHGATLSGFVPTKRLPIEKRAVITFEQTTGDSPQFVKVRIEKHTVVVIEDREATQEEIDQAE